MISLSHFVQVCFASVCDPVARRSDIWIEHGHIGEGRHDDAAHRVKQGVEHGLRAAFDIAECFQRGVRNDKAFAQAQFGKTSFEVGEIGH